MRVAVISANRKAEDGEAVPLALFPFLGGSIASRQAQQAIELGCEYVALVCQTSDPEIIRIQHLVEAGGATFLRIANGHQLATKFSSEDTLIVFADGVVWNSSPQYEVMDRQAWLTTLPEHQAVQAGFERIDAGDAWAGMLTASANLTASLTDLPPDASVQSALLRLTLQAGAERHRISMDDGLSPRDTMPRTVEELHRLETRLIAAVWKPVSWRTPVLALIDRMALGRAAVLLRRGLGGIAGVAITLIFMTVAGLLGWLFDPAWGFAVLVAAVSVGSLVHSLSGVATWQGQNHSLSENYQACLRVGWSTAFICLTALAVPPADRIEAAFAAAILAGLIALALRVEPNLATGPLTDNVLLTATLALAAFFGILLPVIQALALVALLAILFASPRLSLTSN